MFINDTLNLTLKMFITRWYNILRPGKKALKQWMYNIWLKHITKMSEEEAYIRGLTEDRLEMVPHDIYKWVCCVEGCSRYTRIKDYGISPVYGWRRTGFVDLSEKILVCGRHKKGKLTASGKYLHLGNDFLKLKEGPGIDHLINN